jgi:UDP:flavonoid glycosyltransferase YjiC (YdhE family)
MRVLITSFGSYGDLNPYLGLGQTLKTRGHRPVLAMSPGYRTHVEDAGLEFHPTGPEGDPADRQLVARVMDPVRGAEYLMRHVMMPTLRRVYDDLSEAARNTDVVVSHPLSFPAPVLCEQRGLPWADSLLAPLSFFSRADPPLVALPSPLAASVHRRWPGAFRPINSIGQWMAGRWTEPVQALRQSVGLPRGPNPMVAGQFSPHLNLALFSRELAAPQPDWPPHTVVTGCIHYDAVHGGLTPEVEAFLAAGPPPVVFTLGSSAVALPRAAHFYDISAAAAHALGLRAILLVGRTPENRPTALSGDVLVTEWAPHSALFPRAAAVVHQGGAGTLHSALAAGKPMIVVPFAFDQPDNAARVERLGVARVIYPQQYTALRVRRMLDELLNDEGIAVRADIVGATVRAENGALAASIALEHLAAGAIVQEDAPLRAPGR